MAQARGLEGVPDNNGEVFMIDGVREAKLGSDTRALIALWLVAAAVAGLSIWGRSVILPIFSALALQLALWWTIVKWRASSETRCAAPN